MELSMIGGAIFLLNTLAIPYPHAFANMGYKAVRNQRYKYIQYTDLEGVNELYDLVNDPYELHNVIDNPEMSTVINEMKEQLNQLLQQTSDGRLP